LVVGAIDINSGKEYFFAQKSDQFIVTLEIYIEKWLKIVFEVGITAIATAQGRGWDTILG
jgi:hypothetical protein